MSQSFKEFALGGSPSITESEMPPRAKSLNFEGNDNSQPYTTRNHHRVYKHLNQWHILLITISGVIGMGLFANSGEILRIAGPMGGITAYLIVGIFVICVMECIAEMVGHWPIANCMFEFVAKFVDKDLAVVVGIAYWYCYAIGFATLIVVAANLASFWTWSSTIQDLIFTVGIMAILIAINCLGVLWYARVESVLGWMKILLVVGSFLTMLGINLSDTGADTPNGRIGKSNIDDGYQHDPNVARNTGVAVLVAIPIAAYAYCGVEIVAVTALEAKNEQSLKFPAKWIAWITTLAYVISVIGFYLNVSWLDVALPIMEGRKNEMSNNTITTPSNSTTMQNTALVIIATLEAKVPALPSILNIGLIIAVLSTSNTCLYVASRTLFGLTRKIDKNDPIWGWMLRFSRTTPRTRIPAFALLFSALSFCWVPFLRFSKSLTNQELQEIMSAIATVGVVIVWAALCAAFIRYRWWLKMWEGELVGRYKEYNYWLIENNTVPFRTVLGGYQPAPAWIGLISCILIILVFSTASWWDNEEKGDAVVAALAGPLILFGIWGVRKGFKWRSGRVEWYVKLGTWEELKKVLDLLRGSRESDDNNDDPATDQPVQQEHSVASPSWRAPNFPNLPTWLGGGGNVFTPLSDQDPVHDFYRGNNSGNVSPATRPAYGSLGIHDPNGFELVHNPSHGSEAGHTRASDLYRVSIPGSPRRKPVPSTGSISVHSELNLGDSMQRLSPPTSAANYTQFNSARSLSLADISPAVSTRRSSNTLLPPERSDFLGPGLSRPALVDERDLSPQDSMRRVVWGQQLTPQSPGERISRKAVSEPDTGPMRTGDRQRLQRSREREGLRDEALREGSIPAPPAQYQPRGSGDIVDEALE